MQTERFALPNLLAGENLVAELIQDAVTPERIAAEVGALLGDPARREALAARFTAMHEALRQQADRKAAAAVLELVGRLPEPLS
jgi:lipid-A-disaccharide synthase